MPDWIMGKPPKEIGKQWIIETKGQKLYIVSFNSVKSFYFVDERTGIHWHDSIVRYLPYEPIAKPLKPFRQFTILNQEGVRGVGVYDPNTESEVKYTVRWEGKINYSHYSIESLSYQECMIVWSDPE